MDYSAVGGLVNSISRFIHLVACQSVKAAPFLNHFGSIVAMLKLLKPVLVEVTDSHLHFDKELKVFEELDVHVNDAREMLEKHAQKMSKICNTLQCEPLVVKIRCASMEICHALRNLLNASSLTSISASVECCVQQLECIDVDLTSELIEIALRDQKEYVTSSPEHIMKIAESLALTSNQDLLAERIALEKEKMKAESMKRKVDVDLIDQSIDLVIQISNCVAKQEHFGITNHFPVPSYFRCPLSLELMLDPVIVASGQTYERTFIQKWIDSGLKICPKTHQTLSHTNLVPNYTVKALIANWFEENRMMSVHPVHSVTPSCITFVTSEEPSIDSGVQRTNCQDLCLESSAIMNCLDREQAEVSTQSGEAAGRLPCCYRASDKAFLSDPFVEQQPCGDSQSESISSSISSIEVLSKSDDRAYSPSHNHLVSSPWLSSHQLQFSVSDASRNQSPFPCSSSDNLTSSHVQKLVDNLKGENNEVQNAAAIELRLLAKHNMDNRVLIAESGAIVPLIHLLHSPQKLTQENAVTALLNLSINDDNRIAIAEGGGIGPLIHVLKCGTTVAKENAAATLSSISILEEYKIKIGQTTAIKALVDLLGSGNLRGKKDAATALFNLSIFYENKARIVQAGAVKYLVDLMEPDSGMVDKSVALLANLSAIAEGCMAITQEGGIPLLVEVVETGSDKGKENAASTLLQLCINSQRFCNMVLQEGAVPPLIALSRLGTPRAKVKAQQILGQFRSQREGNFRKGKP